MHYRVSATEAEGVRKLEAVPADPIEVVHELSEYVGPDESLIGTYHHPWTHYRFSQNVYARSDRFQIRRPGRAVVTLALQLGFKKGFVQDLRVEKQPYIPLDVGVNETDQAYAASYVFSRGELVRAVTSVYDPLCNGRIVYDPADFNDRDRYALSEFRDLAVSRTTDMVIEPNTSPRAFQGEGFNSPYLARMIDDQLADFLYRDYE